MQAEIKNKSVVKMEINKSNPWFGIYTGINITKQGKICLVHPMTQLIFILNDKNSPNDYWGVDNFDTIIRDIEPLTSNEVLELRNDYYESPRNF